MPSNIADPSRTPSPNEETDGEDNNNQINELNSHENDNHDDDEDEQESPRRDAKSADIKEIPAQQQDGDHDDHDDDEEDDQEHSDQLAPPVELTHPASRHGSRASSRGSTHSDGKNSPIVPRERFPVLLINELSKKHTCPQCKEVLRYPVQFEECGHCVCSSCFHEFLRVEPRCPSDQGKINRDKAFLNKSLNEEVMALDIKCNNHEWGCKWEGHLRDSQSHTETCEYLDILCINDCGAKFQRRFQQKHLDKDCTKKIILCAFCDERFLRENKKNHLEECMKVPLPCPNKCDKKISIPRSELDAHIEKECPRTKIVCQFEDIGCVHRSSREKLPKHYKTGIIEHVRLIYDLLMKHGQRLDQHQELLQDHSALLETHHAQLTDLERVARQQLIWRIDEFSRKFKEAKAGNTTTLFSPPFTTSKHGYRLCASLCLNGDGKGKGSHVSAFISILKGAYDPLLKWPFSYRVSFFLLDQAPDSNNRRHIKFSIKPNPCSENEPFLGMPKLEKNASFGGAKFVKHDELEGRTYVKEDTIYIKISVDCDGCVEP